MVKGAHSAPLYSMHRLGERLFATGDDAGWIKVRCHSLDAMCLLAKDQLHMILYA